MNRRYFIKSSGISMASFGLMAAAPEFLHHFADAEAASEVRRGKILITIFQRGAVDGLNMVVPFGESEYYNVRRTIAVPKPGQEGGALNLDGFFGLHPQMTAFEELWREKRLAVVHSSGSPDNTRSHFDAQDYMESGTPGRKSTPDGWLNRLLASSAARTDSAFRGVAMGQQTPRSLMGTYPTISMANLAEFSIRAGAYTGAVQGGFESIYHDAAMDTLGETGKETFEAVNFLKKADPARFRPENGAVYPNTGLGRSLSQIAQLIKAGVGLETAFAEMGGWDTHTNQGGARGQLANLLRDFSAATAALVRDLGKRMDDVVILTMSEFGRTARENGGRGTDHGHGNAMFVIGNSVRGGKVYGDWKGLRPDQLNEGRDLAVTTDFRDVFAEAAQKHLGNKSFDKIFPGYKISDANFRGIIRP